MERGGQTRAVLFELVIVTLFLALATVTALGFFTVAHKKSSDGLHRTHAYILAQNALERLTAGESLPDTSVSALGDDEYRVVVDVRNDEGSAGVLSYYTVKVYLDSTECAALETAWYWPEVGA